MSGGTDALRRYERMARSLRTAFRCQDLTQISERHVEAALWPCPTSRAWRRTSDESTLVLPRTLAPHSSSEQNPHRIAAKSHKRSGPKESAYEEANAWWIAFVLLLSLHALAQYGQENRAKTDAQEKQAQKSAKNKKTVTGCLQKGDEPDEFSIQGEDGKSLGPAE